MSSRSESTHWHARAAALAPRPDAQDRAWLFDPGSLTRRLVAACPGRFRVDLVSQRRARPTAGESRRLGLRAGRWAIVREVVLRCDERPWVFARTVIPLVSIRGRLRRFTRLGTRPLGAVLFAQRGLEREPFEIARVRPGHALHVRMRSAVGVTSPVWARRAVYRLDAGRLLVTEAYLPERPAWRAR